MFFFQNVKLSTIIQFVAAALATLVTRSRRAINKLMKHQNNHKIHAYQRHADQIQSVKSSMKVQLVHVCQHTLEHPRIADRNVQSIQNVQQIERASIKDVSIPVKAHVASTHNVL